MAERNQSRGRRHSRPGAGSGTGDRTGGATDGATDSGAGGATADRAGAPPTPLESGEPAESARHFAVRLREEFFARLDLGYAELSRRIAAGVSARDLSRFANGTKLPAFEDLDAILAFAEKDYASLLPADAVRELRACHLQAVKECSPAAYDLRMAVEEVQAWRARYAHSEGATALASTRWRYAVLAREQAAAQLLRTESAAEREAAAADRDRALEAAHAERATVQAENVRVRSQLLAVRNNLNEQVHRLEAEVTRLTEELTDARQEQRKAWDEGAQLAEQLADAEAQVLAEQARSSRLEDEVRLLNEMRQLSLREREVHQAQQEARLREHQVLADAQAAVDAARQLEEVAPLAIGAGAAHAGTSPGGAAGSPDSADGVGDGLRTTAVVGGPAEVAEVVRRLDARSDPAGVREVLALAAERPGAEVVALVQALEEAGCYPQKELLLIEAARQPAVMVAAAVRALHEVDRAAEIGWLLEAAAKAVPQDVTSLTLELLGRGMRADAGRLLDAAAPRRAAHEVADLVVVLFDAGWVSDAERLVKDAAIRRSGREVVELLRTLLVSAAEPLAAQVASVAAGRAPTAVAATVRALVEAGESQLVGTVLRETARRPVPQVVRTCVALADAECRALGVWLASARAGAEEDCLQELVDLLGRDGRGDLVSGLLDAVARECPAGETPGLLKRLRAVAASAYSAVARQIARRPWKDVLRAVRALERELPEAAAFVLGEFVHRPVSDVLPFLDRWLDLAGEDAVEQLPDTVVDAGLSLGHLLELGAALREAGRSSQAAGLLRAAGARQRIAPDLVCAALDLGVHGVGVRQVLAGWATRPGREVVPLVDLLLRTGHEVSAWYAIDRFVQEASAQGLYAVWELLRDGDARDGERDAGDALDRLVDELVESAGYSVVALLVGLLPQQDGRVLLRRIASLGEPAEVAEQLAALAAAGEWQAFVRVMQAVAGCPRKRVRAVAESLVGSGRSRQARWLTSQAGRPAPLRGASGPCGEQPQETVDMVAALSHGDTWALSLGVAAESARYFPTAEVVDLVRRLHAEPRTRDLAVDLCGLPRQAAPALRPENPVDVADLAHLLRETLRLPQQADTTLLNALVDLPARGVGELVKRLSERGREADLTRVVDLAPKVLESEDLLVVASELIGFDDRSARAMVRSALTLQEHAGHLPELVGLILDNNLGSPDEIMDLVAAHHPPEVAAALRLNAGSAGGPTRDLVVDTPAAQPPTRRPSPAEQPRSEVFTAEAVDDQRLFHLYFGAMERDPYLFRDRMLHMLMTDLWHNGRPMLGEVTAACRALCLALLRLPPATAKVFRRELDAACRWSPAHRFEIPLNDGRTPLRLTAPASAVPDDASPGPGGLDVFLSMAVGEALQLVREDLTLGIVSPSGQILALHPGSGETVLGGVRGVRDTLLGVARDAAEVRGDALIAHQVQAYGRLDAALGSLVHSVPAALDSWWGRRRQALLERLRIMTERSGAGILVEDPQREQPDPPHVWLIAPAILHGGYQAPCRKIIAAESGFRVLSRDFHRP